MNVTHSLQGDAIDTLDELKYELVLASFRELDMKSNTNKWFYPNVDTDKLTCLVLDYI